MYVSIEHQRKLDLQRHCILKSHITISNPKRTQVSDPHFITKRSDVIKQASMVEVKTAGFLAEYNLPLAACLVSKCIFPDSNIVKEHSNG